MGDLSDLSVILPEIPEFEGCQIAGQGDVFVVPGGTDSVVLEWVLIGTDGQPVDLTDAIDNDEYTFPVRFREAVVGSKIYTTQGAIADAEAGKIQTYVPNDVMIRAGVYEANFSVTKNGKPVLIRPTYVLVERSLFDKHKGLMGPPLVQEIQTHLADIAAKNESGTVEFSAKDLALALVQPIRQWNETTPRIRVHSTIDFDSREHWLKGTCGYLLRSAAAYYRRNRYPVNAGGVVIDDKDKENPYLEASQVYLAEWQEFITRRKVEINVKRCRGESGSIYE
jgi:hypothetical protein